MGTDNPFPADVSKRQFLKLTGSGAVAGTGLASTASGQESQRPTITAEETGCRRLTVTYTSGQVPLRVSLEGPTPESFNLGPGMVASRTVDPGEYTVEATPTRGSSQSAAAARVEGSPVTVDECSGVRVRAFCGDLEGVPMVKLEITNATGVDISGSIWYHTGEDPFAGLGFHADAGETTGAGWYVDWLQQNVNYLTFEAEVRSTNEPVSVEPSRIDLDSLSCMQE